MNKPFPGRRLPVAVLIFVLFGMLLLNSRSYGQGRLQFQENKGQWNPAVLYRAQLPNGYIYLRKTGITYSLLSGTDMQALRERVHGHIHASDSAQLPYDKGPRHSSNRYTGNNRTASPPGGDLPLAIHGHAYQVNFLNSSPATRITADQPSKARYNYLIGDRSHWGQNVRAFGGITYQDLYPMIDMHLYSDRQGLKYDLIVKPGSDPEDIRFEYSGADALYLKNGHLYIKTSVGTNIEVSPYAYQVIDNRRVEVRCKYHLEGDILTFRIGAEYEPGHTLVIDPNFIFATYSGSNADNWGYTATYDREGNFYMGGIVFSSGYPVTPGAFQDSIGSTGNYGNGGFDISLSKLSPDGTQLIYATYLGGDNAEQPHSLIVNSKNQLIISGRTRSTNFPGDRVGNGGGWDMILTELTADGSNTVGSLIIGGSGDDGVNIADKYTPVQQGSLTYSLRRFYGDDARSEVNLDAQENIIVVGSTQSDKDFPVTSAFQPAFGGGLQDAVVIKADPDLSGLQWASYLGGSENDAAYVLDFSNTGNIYVAGGTESSDFPGTSGTFQPNIKGHADGFIAEVRANGSSLVRATYLGTGQRDQIYGIQSDKDGDIYVGGTTEGVWDFPGVIHFPADVPNGKQFIAKFNSGLTDMIYTATFGSTGSQKASQPNISPTAFLVDRCENVYMSGWGGSIDVAGGAYATQGTRNLPIKDPLNIGTPDGNDFYFFVMKKDATDILFADTYGQNGGFPDHVDGGTSRFDPTGVIYQAICANCGGGTIFPTGPPGVYSRENGSLTQGSGGRAACNEVGFKIAFNLDGVRGGVAPLDRRHLHCYHEEVTFIDTLYGRPAESWTWDVFKNDTTNHIAGPEITDTSVFHYTFDEVGNYIVRMIKYNPGDCIERDTSYTNIRIGDNPARLKLLSSKLPPCSSFKYQFVNLSTSDKINPIEDSSFVWDFGDGSGNVPQTNDSMIHFFPEAGNYTVRLTLKDTANFCNTPLDSVVLISASDILEAGLQAPETVCSPGTYPLTNTTLGGTNYIWTITRPDQTDTTIERGDLNSVQYPFDAPGQYHIKLVARDTVCHEADSVESTLTAYPHPSASFTVTTNQPHQDTVVNAVFYFNNTSQSNFTGVDSTLNYLWYFGDGHTSTKKNPWHLYAKTGTYQVNLITTNPAGCSDTATTRVTEKIIPALDVPTAFTPGSGDINSHVAPRAFGIVKIDFRIYNRWGQLVYHSNDPEITYLPDRGWDGTYKGKPQEMDAYAYILNVVFENGETATKKGSITLIR